MYKLKYLIILVIYFSANIYHNFLFESGKWKAYVLSWSIVNCKLNFGKISNFSAELYLANLISPVAWWLEYLPLGLSQEVTIYGIWTVFYHQPIPCYASCMQWGVWVGIAWHWVPNKNQQHSSVEIQNYSHSCKPDIPVTHSSPFCMWLTVCLFFSLLKPCC